MRKIKAYFWAHWRMGLAIFIAVAVLASVLWFRLSSLTGGKLSVSETELIRSSSSLAILRDNPLLFPLKVPIFILLKLGFNSVFALRSVVAAFGAASALLLYIVLRRLHTKRVATFGILLFITSSWFLQTSRLIGVGVFYLFAICLIWGLMAWLHSTIRSRLAVILLGATFSMMFYIPGFIWLIGFLLLWRIKDVGVLLRKAPWWAWVLSVLAGLLFIAPLALAALTRNISLMDILGLPQQLEPLEWLKRLLILPATLFARGPLEPTLNLARLPLLDMASSVLLILGSYVLFTQRKLFRVKLLFITTVFAAIMIALNGPVLLPLLLPTCYVVACFGMALLLQQWLIVFPRNPLARSIGIFAVVAMLGFIGSYHLKRYFVAWPNNKATKISFQEKVTSP